MQALRMIEQVNNHTLTLTMPEAFWQKRVEVIVLPCVDEITTQPVTRRKPSPLLADTRITGDIVSPVCAPEEWDALK